MGDCLVVCSLKAYYVRYELNPKKYALPCIAKIAVLSTLYQVHVPLHKPVMLKIMIKAHRIKTKSKRRDLYPEHSSNVVNSYEPSYVTS